MTLPIDPTDHALEARLRDLGGHLDLDLGPGSTPGVGAGLVAAVVAQIAPPATGVPPRRVRAPRPLLVAAAVALVALAGVVAVAPARDAVASWLGIGAVEIRPRATAPAAGDLPARSDLPMAPVDVDALERQLPFAVRLLDPARAGAPLGAAVDPAVPSGLLEVRYREVTLVEVASRPDRSPALSKIVGPDTTITSVSVGGRPGLWLAGEPHLLTYLDPDGTPRSDAVRRSGAVLLWEDGGVTYRIEGAPSLAEARALAAALR